MGCKFFPPLDEGGAKETAKQQFTQKPFGMTSTDANEIRSLVFALWIIQSHTTHFVWYASSMLDTRHSLIVLSYRRQIALCSNHLNWWTFYLRLRLRRHFRLKPWDYGRRWQRRRRPPPNWLKSNQMFYNIQFGYFSTKFSHCLLPSGFCHSLDADFTLICAQYAIESQKFLLLCWIFNLAPQFEMFHSFGCVIFHLEHSCLFFVFLRLNVSLFFANFFFFHFQNCRVWLFSNGVSFRR